MRNIFWHFLFVSSLLFGMCSQSDAHLLPEDIGTINIANQKHVYVTLNIPIALLRGVDDNADGLLSEAELTEHREQIKQQVISGFKLEMSDATGRESSIALRPMIISLVASSPSQNSRDVKSATSVSPTSVKAEKNIIFMATGSSEQDIGKLTVNVPLMEHAAENYQFKLFARHAGESRELILLNKHQENAFFFQGTQSIFLSFVQAGVMHILEGADHLLFIFMVMILAVRFKPLLLSLTLFTVAHSISLLGLHLGWLSLSATFIRYGIEPMIALSIVVTACLAYRRLYHINGKSRSHVQKNEGWLAYAIIFAFGLIHGCGFGASLQLDGLSQKNLWWSLFGFNLGVEIGQILFVCTVGILFYGLQKLQPRFIQPLKVIFIILAVSVGMILIVQRICLT
jgi:hydrogenase/urease accessory protein HupE